MSSYDYKHAFEAWYDNGCKRGQKPANVVRLGPAAPLEDQYSAYKAFMFRRRGKIIIAIGCRRFTLDEAKAWWGGVASVRVTGNGDQHTPSSLADAYQRRRRAIYIKNNLVKRAARRAAKLGWKL